jgi:predicted Fe-Mo cluster-binding NifX family protein
MSEAREVEDRIGRRIAVPVSGGALAEHFGHCDEFAIFRTNAEETAIEGVVRIPAPPHQPGFLPGWLRGLGVDVIVAGGMGRRAQDLFRGNLIEVVVGASAADARDAAQAYIDGTLVRGTNPCDH